MEGKKERKENENKEMKRIENKKKTLLTIHV